MNESDYIEEFDMREVAERAFKQAYASIQRMPYPRETRNRLVLAWCDAWNETTRQYSSNGDGT